MTWSNAHEACMHKPPPNAPDMIDSISYIGDASPPFDGLTVPHSWIDMNKNKIKLSPRILNTIKSNIKKYMM